MKHKKSVFLIHDFVTSRKDKYIYIYIYIFSTEPSNLYERKKRGPISQYLRIARAITTTTPPQERTFLGSLYESTRARAIHVRV